jgi:hypothetical protein
VLLYLRRLLSQILVLEVEPSSAPAVLIINTDCVVNIEPPLGGSLTASISTGGDGTGGSATAGSSSKKTLALGEVVSGAVLKASPAVYTLKIPTGAVLSESDVLLEVRRPVEVSAGVALGGSAVAGGSATHGAGEADVYVDAAPQKAPSLLRHKWKWNGIGSAGAVRVSDAMPLPGASSTVEAAAAAAAPRTFYVSVTTLSDSEAPFELRASLVPKAAASDSAAPLTTAAHAIALGPDDVLCGTCNAAVPKARYDMHSAVCAVRHALVIQQVLL